LLLKILTGLDVLIISRISDLLPIWLRRYLQRQAEGSSLIFHWGTSLLVERYATDALEGARSESS